MAEDWIKMRTKLWNDGRVRKMSRALRTKRGHVCGALFRLWSLADDYASDEGELEGYDIEDLDEEVELEGFTRALPDCWMDIRDGSLYLPDYVEHNGSTAKKRASDSKRKKSERRPKKVASEADKSRTREEKRRGREEESDRHTPSTRVDAASFDRFWATYPRKVGKAAAAKAFATATKRGGTSAVKIIQACEAYAASPRGRESDANLIPHPSTWLNQGRYDDDRSEWQTPATRNGKANGSQPYTDYDPEKIGGDI